MMPSVHSAPSFPQWLSWARRQPFLVTLLLRARNHYQRLSVRIKTLAVVAVLSTVGTGALVALKHAVDIAAGLSILQQHAGWVTILSAVHSATMVTRRRKRLTVALTQSWIAATPRAALSLRNSIICGALWRLVWQLALLSGLMAYAGRSDLQTAKTVMLSMVCGFAIGAAAAWGVPVSTARWKMPGSRYVPRLRGGSQTSMRASFGGLSRWPVAAAFARLHPDVLRWPVMAALLSVGGGSSALAGMTVLGMWMLVLYMVTLCGATLQIIREAALWLSMTPVNARAFAANVLGRSLVHQVLAGSIFASALAATRLPPLQALALAMAWIAFVMLAYGSAVARRFGSR